jgi:enoyl-CoA hydratase
VVLLTGQGRGFCAGADLLDIPARPEADHLWGSPDTFLTHIQKRYARGIMDLRRWPQPVVAAVNGPAAGGGMCLALASDVRHASPSATFIASFINIGLSGGELGSSYFLPRLIGASRASEILFTGRTVDAAEAERIGLVSRVVPEDELMDAALDTARVMLTKSDIGLRQTKEVIHQNLTAPSMEAAVELENRNQSVCAFAGDFKRAVEAFWARKNAKNSG